MTCYRIGAGDVVMLEPAVDADARLGERDEDGPRKQPVYVPRCHSEALSLSSGKPVCVAAPASRSRVPPRGVRGLPRFAGTPMGYIGLSWGRTGISPLTSLADIARLEFPQPLGRHSPVIFVQFVS